MQKLSYTLTITQRGAQGDKNLKNVFTSDNPEKVLKDLARCYRDLNRAERAHAIIRARHWVKDLYNDENKKDCFTIEYDLHSDHSVITVYNWVFDLAL